MGYEEALQLIAEARETGTRELDLFSQELIELPPEIFQLRQLTRLDISNNQLTKLPPEIMQLKNLNWIYLHGNPLTSPPIELAVQGIDAIRKYFAHNGS
ncbi:MAG: leucine-rich repeat domain-containing protein [Candidatus Electrothrix sp. AW1]|nr:leucine-rich repeat domain-containing protein [Candidatus Electrothrix sp. AX1]MCI5183942.1 leucine-rich repeat domain-containing protein [Candidatus Electrothrix gigas]